jgi:tetraacyldisaccharide 4'-kinase
MRILLLPLSWLFRFMVFFRNKLYDYGFFKTIDLNSRVISVGNISVGGTGKTPLVEYIARYFLRRNKFVVILTKGYKREIDDMQVVELGFQNKEHKLTTDNFGDETMMLLENFSGDSFISGGKGLLVAAEKKRSGAKLADSKFKPDLILIDDGFQTRNIFRNLDLVILNPHYRGLLLPAGNFREPYSSTKRADLIIMNLKFFDDHVLELKKFRDVPCFKYELDGFYNYNSEVLSKNNVKATAFCGIGDPASFRKLLENIKVEVVDFIEYPDHHNYENKDIRTIIDKFKANKSEVILTTQKDFVRFKYSRDIYQEGINVVKELVHETPFYFAKIELKFVQNEDILFERLAGIIKE